MSASPLPRYHVTDLPRRRGGRAWYIVTDIEYPFGSIRGGPYPTEADAEGELERRYQEIHELYEAVEADARRHGYTVQW